MAPQFDKPLRDLLRDAGCSAGPQRPALLVEGFALFARQELGRPLPDHARKHKQINEPDQEIA